MNFPAVKREKGWHRLKPRDNIPLYTHWSRGISVWWDDAPPCHSALLSGAEESSLSQALSVTSCVRKCPMAEGSTPAVCPGHWLLSFWSHPYLSRDVSYPVLYFTLWFGVATGTRSLPKARICKELKGVNCPNPIKVQYNYKISLKCHIIKQLYFIFVIYILCFSSWLWHSWWPGMCLHPIWTGQIQKGWSAWMLQTLGYV